MAFGSSSDNSMRYTIEVDASGAIRAFDSLGNIINQVPNTTKKAEDGFTSFERKVIALNQTIGLLKEGFSIASEVISKTMETLERAGKVQDVAQAFERLSKAAGTTGDVFLNKLNQATGSTVANFDLQRKSIEALRAGMKPDEMLGLAKAARLFSKEGSDLGVELDALTRAYEMGSDRLLKFRGINIDSAKAEKDFSTAVFGSVQPLNEQGKILAMREAMMAALNQRTKEAGIQEKDLGDRVDGLKKSYRDVIDKTLEKLAADQELNKALDDLAGTLSSMPWGQYITGIAGATGATVSFLQSWGEWIGKGLRPWKDVFGAEGDDFQTRLEHYKKGSEDFGIAIQATNVQLKEGTEASVKDALAAWNRLVGMWQNPKFPQSVRDQWLAPMEALAKEVDKVAGAHKPLKKAEDDSGTTTEDLRKKHKAYAAALLDTDKVAEKLKKTEEEANKIRKMNTIASIMQLKDQLTQLWKSYQEGNLTLDEFNRARNETIAADMQEGMTLETVSESLSKFNKGLSDTKGLYDKLNNFNLSKMFGGEGKGNMFGFDIGVSDDTASKLIQTGEQMAQLLMDAFTGHVKKDKEWAKQMGGAIGGVIGSIWGGPAGGMAGQLAGNMLGGLSYDFQMWAKKQGGAKGNMLGMLDFIGWVFFGHQDSAGTQAKKQLDKYFSDLFEHNRLTAIINGELKQINDLQFGGNQDPSQGLAGQVSDNVKQQFNSVGKAFEELMGVAGDLGVNLGNVLLNNLGGSLNNLQLLIQATGKSFEELGNAIMNAFLGGNMTILDAQVALEQLKGIMQKGIPGAIGNVKQAWENFQAAIKDGKGGRALLDALADIGAEAQELHMTTLPQLADYLTNTLHYDAKMVEAFMAAMKATGINSITDLVNASQEQLLAFAANIQEVIAGNQPTHKAVPISDNKTPTGGGSSGSNARQQQLSELYDMVTASSAYAEILRQLNEKEISRTQAQKEINTLYKDASIITKKLAEYEKQAQAELEKTGKVSVVTASQIDRLNNAKKALTGEDDGNSPTINSALLSFMKQWGDRVDYIRIAANAAGVSFDDMKQSAIDAFLAGKKTAAEALSDMNKGQAGSSGEAFSNLLTSGTKGGRFSVDALKQIFQTAKAAGAKTMDDVIAQLRAQGISESEISALFQTLGAMGYTSIDQIATASDETAIQIIAALNKTNLPFQETSDALQKLLDQIEKIKNTPATVKVNFEANMPDWLKKLLRDYANINVDSYGGKDSPGKKSSRASA